MDADAIKAAADRLVVCGMSQGEAGDFMALGPSEDEWLLACLMTIRQDRNGVIADQKRKRSAARQAALAASPSRRIRNATTARVWAALKGKSDGALFSRLGYSASALAEHIEAQFGAGMSWANYGKWHVDHIRPCAAFDLTDPAQFAECWALDNLRPLWAQENCKKGARLAA